jgi:hypothetical protein
MGKLLVAALLMLVAGGNALAQQQPTPPPAAPVPQSSAPPPIRAELHSVPPIDRLKARPTRDDCWGHDSARMGDVVCNGSRVKLITDPD